MPWLRSLEVVREVIFDVLLLLLLEERFLFFILSFDMLSVLAILQIFFFRSRSSLILSEFFWKCVGFARYFFCIYWVNPMSYPLFCWCAMLHWSSYVACILIFYPTTLLDTLVSPSNYFFQIFYKRFSHLWIKEVVLYLFQSRNLF